MNSAIFPQLSDQQRLSQLSFDSNDASRPLHIVLDTDTYNEVDDQFALAHALLSPADLVVDAIYAAPFHNDRSNGPGDGMEKSYAEILRVLDRLNRNDAAPVLRGSELFLPDTATPVRSAAAADLVERALAQPAGTPLTVVAIGAITNIASALLLEPEIVRCMRVIWLGGHALHWPHIREFNLKQDVPAAQVVFDSGVPLVLLPCMGVVSHLHTTVPELERYVAGRSVIGDYLTEIVRGYHDDHEGWSKVIWDVATTAFLLDSAWAPSVLLPTPIVTDQVTWSEDRRRPLMRYVYHVNRDAIFRDLFRKLAAA